MKIFVTCEHGGNEVPVPYQYLFRNASERLKSHEGWDIGALQLAKKFFNSADFYIYSTITRLLVDLNRSPHHPGLFSSITNPLSAEEKVIILSQYYYPYRNKVLAAIKDQIDQNQCVLHLSVHSFTPELKGKVRQTDIGLLYDPQRKEEKQFCDVWRKKINAQADFKVRFNYPYLGWADGFVTFLRKQFPATHYVGLELEVNQKIMQNKFEYQKLEPILMETFIASAKKRGTARG